jgi:hypothetical protein
MWTFCVFMVWPWSIIFNHVKIYDGHIIDNLNMNFKNIHGNITRTIYESYDLEIPKMLKQILLLKGLLWSFGN